MQLIYIWSSSPALFLLTHIILWQYYHKLLYTKIVLHRFRISSSRMTRPYTNRLPTEPGFRDIYFAGQILFFKPDRNHPLDDDPGLTRHPVLLLHDSLKTTHQHDPLYFAGLVISHRPQNSIESWPIKGSNTAGTPSTTWELCQFEGWEDNTFWKPFPFDKNTFVAIRTPIVFPAACLHHARKPSPSKIDCRSLLALNGRLSELMSLELLRPNPPAQHVQIQSNRGTHYASHESAVSQITEIQYRASSAASTEFNSFSRDSHATDATSGLRFHRISK